MPGNIFVDSSCIDCDTCRWYSSGVFYRENGQSAVHTQPKTRAEELDAFGAMAACPTGSIRTETPSALTREAAERFPTACVDGSGMPVAGVFYNGFAARETFGASSWLAISDDCNVLIDCPRYSDALARRMESVCGERGVDYIVLTHSDDVHGHEEWQKRLGARRIIHEAECNTRQGTTACEWQVGTEELPLRLGEQISVLHVAGHTRGSVAILHEGSHSLFTGDHMWGSADGVLTASAAYCSFSWATQIESVAALSDVPFLHVWPGHGRPLHFVSDEEREMGIRLTVERMWKSRSNSAV